VAKAVGAPGASGVVIGGVDIGRVATVVRCGELSWYATTRVRGNDYAPKHSGTLFHSEHQGQREILLFDEIILEAYSLRNGNGDMWRELMCGC
jgi:hypothetical protein